MAHFKMGHYSIFAFMEEKRCIQENNKEESYRLTQTYVSPFALSLVL